MNASLVSVGLASSLHILLLWSIQENVRSTTHLRGSTWKPLGGMSFSQSTFIPSLAHSLAHALSTSSGAALRARSTSSTLQPRVFSTTILALVLSTVARVQPQMTQARESLLCSI